MANLITEKQKRLIKIEYFVRLFSVYLLIPISLLGFFLLAYLVPYYLSVSEKDLKVAEQFKSVLNVENKENTGENVSKIVDQTVEQMKAVELYGGTSLVPSVYFNKIISNKNPDIKITKLSFSPVNNKQAQFLVGGTAKSREGLVIFIEDLKSKAGFSSVDSPVSDFAKNSNIPFTITLKTTI